MYNMPADSGPPALLIYSYYVHVSAYISCALVHPWDQAVTGRQIPQLVGKEGGLCTVVTHNANKSSTEYACAVSSSRATPKK